MSLIETTVGGLRASDVGRRVVITQEGVAFDGILTGLDVDRGDHNFADQQKWPKIYAALEVKTLTPGEGTESDRIHAAITLRKLPLDYRIQIEDLNLLTLPDVEVFTA